VFLLRELRFLGNNGVMSPTDGGVAFLANGQVTTVSSQLLIANPETDDSVFQR
jgi:hypothetical protein